MSNNMKEHCNLLFDIGVDAILKKPSIPECVHKVVKRGPTHLKHVHSLYIIVVVDVVQICNSLSIALKHGSICDRGPYNCDEALSCGPKAFRPESQL
jgi:hypothetical protein